MFSLFVTTNAALLDYKYLLFFSKSTIKDLVTFHRDLKVCQCIITPQERIMMQNHPVRNKTNTTSPLLLQHAVRLKKRMAGLTASIRTKIPEGIRQAIFTPMSQCHQRFRFNQRPSFTPLLALTNTQSAALSHISLKLSNTPPLHTNQQKNQHTVVTSELRADHLNPLLCYFTVFSNC